jgi:vitamin B12 transporter
MDLNGVYMGKELSDDYRQGAVTPVFMYTPGTTSVDLSIEKGLMTFGANGEGGKLSIRVEVNNMFDNKNETYLDYPGPGRNFYIGLKYQL